MKPVAGRPRLGPCLGNVKNFIAIGLNYADHAAEGGMPIPKEPIIFNKMTTCICGPNDDTIQPKDSTKLDYEVELGIVIGRRARYIARDKAKDFIAGYFVSNDVSERAFQLERSGGQWDKGKGCETFGPIGPWFVTKDEIKDPQNLSMWLDVNGARRQTGNTKTMIFGCEHLVWYCSQFFVMEPGDIIITGTPPGVAFGMKPAPEWLKPGDVVTLGIDGAGRAEAEGGGGEVVRPRPCTARKRGPGSMADLARHLPPSEREAKPARAKAGSSPHKRGSRLKYCECHAGAQALARAPACIASRNRPRSRAAVAVWNRRAT